MIGIKKAIEEGSTFALNIGRVRSFLEINIIFEAIASLKIRFNVEGLLQLTVAGKGQRTVENDSRRIDLNYLTLR